MRAVKEPLHGRKTKGSIPDFRLYDRLAFCCGIFLFDCKINPCARSIRMSAFIIKFNILFSF